MAFHRSRYGIVCERLHASVRDSVLIAEGFEARTLAGDDDYFAAHVPELLAGLDAFAFPSHNEAFGLALIEAMTTGLPTVSSDCDGVLDIVVEGKPG
jgi:glycosyltransferase involved in cell wall biosynthesis